MSAGQVEILADDRFAGAGGWDLGAKMLGVHARGVEIMPEAQQTRDAAGLETIHDDVWTFEPDGKAELAIDSPPCQTFSQAGHGAGRQALDAVLTLLHRVPDLSLSELKTEGRNLSPDGKDDRTALVLTPLWWLIHHDTYRAAAWEQVTAVLPVWEACAAMLEERGWSTWTGFLHSEQYGVPQTRKRAFMLASRDRTVAPPRPTHSRYHPRTPGRFDAGVARWVSMAEALGWAPIPHEAAARGECPCDRTFTATNDRPNVAHRTPCAPAPTLAFGHETPRWNPRKTTPDGRPRFHQQSDNPIDETWPDHRPATVVAGRDIVQAPGATANRFNGSTKSRNDGVRVSVDEAGVLQSFPPDHPWRGKQGAQYLQAGNAVPPLMARAAIAAVLGLDLPPDPPALDTDQPALDLFGALS